MAHNTEPMDIDDESVFDNKENAYQHSNVLPRTPCTEKGYEELDVSELNMKLRYSITPASSPMSKSMTHCLDNRQNTLTDESLNNTVVNENENNLTRSLNSTLNKTEVKSSRVLPLQVLPTDIVDNSRSSVCRPLDTATKNDITITVSDENDIDNLSFASSSSSMAHTPEATTPTKEMPKHDGGSPIMRGLKSVLSIFRSSQSPIPPGEEVPKAANHAVSPADIALPESEPRAVASTPKNENNKERSVSKRNSPLKESVVFNEDLQKELQWSDDSTIMFSSEKIPIHKLFFQDKPSKSVILNENIKHEDANSTVEYMDVSYNDLSIKDKTLNGTININKNTELVESDGEFVDCETTFTQNDAHFKTEELDAAKINNSQIPNTPKKMVENVTKVNEPFTLDTTKDIINSIDASHIVVEGNLGKLDFSTTDIVNQLSDLINDSETSANNVISVENKGTPLLAKEEPSTLSDLVTLNNIQPELLQNQVTSPVYSGTESPVAATEMVSIKNEDLVHTSGIACDTTVGHLESTGLKISLAPYKANAVITHEVGSLISSCDETKTTKAPEETNDDAVGYPSPVDIPLPNDDDINEINDNLLENAVGAELQEKDMLDSSSSQNALMAAIDKSITETTHDIQHKQVETENEVTTCPPSLLPSDVPLHNMDTVDTNKISHEAITVVCDPVQSPAIEKLDTLASMITTNVDPIKDSVNKPTTEAFANTPHVQIEVENIKEDTSCPSDIPLPGMDDDNLPQTDDLAADTVTVVPYSVQQCAIENPEAFSIKDNSTKEDSGNDNTVVIASDQVRVTHGTLTTNFNKSKEEEMEISFIEPINNKLSECVAMDVSMIDANINVGETLESYKKEIQLCKIIPEIISHNIEVIPTDIVNDEQKSAGSEIAFENDIGGTINKQITSGPVSVTAMAKKLSDMPKGSDSLDEDVNASVSLTKSETKPSKTPTINNSQESKTVDDSNEAKIANDLNLNHALEDATVIVATAAPLLNEQNSSTLPVPTDSGKKETCDVKDNTALPDLLKGPDASINLDSCGKVESTTKCKEKIDEEIVLSGSNSPFVSMSAEEEFDPELKTEECEKIENPFSTKSKVALSPPISPKIVSKGYNFNFDDIDNINPFSTKTKIRMSPPPDVSPNTSLVNKEVKKTEMVEPLNTKKNINRRKSMPERKKPLKAKRHFNSTIDSPENVSSKMATSKNDDLENTPTIEVQQDQSLVSQTDLNHIGIKNVASVTQDVSNNKVDVIVTSDVTKYEEKDSKESKAIHGGSNAKQDKNIVTQNGADNSQNDETKIIEDVTSASSSEQSTYFSAGASSTELTNSRNVFNLPELDDFNPFATKSNIRQTPPRDTESKTKSSPELVVTQKDCNSTVTIDNDCELKEATCNISTCSGTSKASEEKDVTIQEVHTEDDDTLEGPFLEADDGDDGDKIPDDKVDGPDFDNLNQPDNDEAAEMFIDAEAFEFLMNQNKTDEVAYSGKESLFLKFDPLFARRVTSEDVAATLNDIKRKQITPKKAAKQAPPKEVELLSFEKPGTGQPDLNITSDTQNVVEERSDDMNVTTSKPMMAVTPAVNPVVTPRKSWTPNRSNRLSMTFTSPAMAVIDRLLSLSGNSLSAGLDASVTYVDRSHSEADQALTQLRELLAEKEINVYNLRCESKELKDRLTTLETQMKALEAESAERLKKVNELTENLAEKTKMNRKMAAVVEEYERTIASLISETEQDKKRFAEERTQLIRDRDEQTAHLTSMEVSFNDLHSKYEKSKQVIMGYKTNEDAYKKSIQEFEENLTKMHTNYELLKQHATSKLNHANQELEKLNKAHEAEVLKFNAMIKRKELHITSLEESLAQKTKANEELTAICDELINKVG